MMRFAALLVAFLFCGNQFTCSVEARTKAQKIALKKNSIPRKKITRKRPHRVKKYGYAYMQSNEPIAAVVFNANTRNVIFSKNAHKQWHPASLTKKMTLYMLFEALVAGQISMNTHFKVSKVAANQPPCKLGLKAGSTIAVKDIILALITKSANDASVVAAEGLAGSREKFSQQMNRKARLLGMKSTTFHNASGLPDARHTSTPYDMIVLANALYHHFPEFFSLFRTTHFNYKGRTYRNHNHMLTSCDGVDGFKTGFTNASGYNISTTAVRYDQSGRPVRLFAVVFGGRNRHERDRYTAKILDQSFKKVGAFKAPDRLEELLHQTSFKG